MCLSDNGGPAIAKDASHNNRAYLVGIGKSPSKKNDLRSSLNSKEVLQYFLHLYEKKTHILGSFSFFILSNFHYSLMNALMP